MAIGEATDTFAPQFAIDVQDKEIPGGVTQLIQRVEYESADGLADVARITAINPDFQVSKAKVFQVGNEMNIWMGYGSGMLKLIGRVYIAKVRPNFPEKDMPTIEVIGYSKDAIMADNAPTVKKPVPKKAPRGRIYKKMKYSDAVKDVASSPEYGFTPDVDDTPDTESTFIQKVGLSDYDFVKGLANITGFMFWVMGDDKGKWTLFFKDPDKFTLQEKEYKFKYDLGDYTTLLSFTPELSIKGYQTKITAEIKDPKTGKVITTEIEEENNACPDIDAAGDPTGEVEGEHSTGSDIKLYLQDFSFDVVANRRFAGPNAEADLKLWVQQWFRRQRENFVMSRGRTIGIEDLAARQVHSIEGVYGGYDGKYYFSKVKHIMEPGGGYFCDFNARKVVPK